MQINPTQQINFCLLAHLESIGKEIKLIKKNKKIIGGFVIEPLAKLLEKGVINLDEYNAGIQYSIDYSLSHLTHHARPNYDGMPINSSKSTERTISQSQLNASKNIQNIITLLEKEKERYKGKDHKSFKSFKSVKSKFKTEKRYILLTNIILEKQFSLYKAREITGLNYDCLESRIKEILKIINTYYCFKKEKNGKILMRSPDSKEL